MRVQKIENITFRQDTTKDTHHKREIIDVIADSVRNPRDVQDCVAVPRGIFKAYISLMAGSSVMLAAAALPKNWKITKTILNIGSAILTGISAIYFAKPFAVNGLSPTTTKEEVQANNKFS